MAAAITAEQVWLREARALQLKLRLGWALQWLSPALLLLGLLFMFVIYGLRWQEGWSSWTLLGMSGLLLLLVLWGWLKSQRPELSLERALARLELSRKLDQRLTMAHAGRCPWPDPTVEEELPLQFRWKKILSPLLLCLCLIGLGRWLPLPLEKKIADPVRLEPAAWKQMEELAERLQEEEWLDEAPLEELQEQVAELRARDPSTWYKPGSLEATDSLMQQLQQDARSMQQGLNQSARLMELAAMALNQQRVGAEQEQAFREVLQQQLQRMAGDTLNLTPEQMQQLEQMARQQLADMNPQQLQRLEDMMRQQGDNLGACMNAAGMRMLAGEGMQPGQGGISRGGGPSELTFKAAESMLLPPVNLALQSRDLRSPVIGEILEIRDSEHEDTVKETSQRAGEFSSQGRGAAVVEEQSFLPEEGKRLQDFFQ